MRFRLTIVDLLVLPITALLLGNMAWQSIDEWRGRSDGVADAKRDLDEGMIGVKGYGKPAPWLRHYQSILSTRFNARYDHLAACGATPYVRSYIQAYNKAMAPTWQAKGIDLDAIALEAQSPASRKPAAQ